ncbi:MAG: hypothetical protein J0I36_06610 [Pandoraea sp.]|uniref:hypothetical protein n=1 Tax=Pandoraea sp. 64-18 TaxID=1895806 RepID=UPI0009630AE4|nr:hypothetical protein [Pandoraea sp. 64-18]MBN9114955.1 hypothetical protein [Pandoraea sp.]OJY23521.1 MAG: hypothetical protein BGP02_04420 [Pandoraea sp. 64-18]
MPLNPRPSDLTIDQLRSLWLTNKDPNVRRAIEEVAFRRLDAQRKERVLGEIEKLYAIIHQEWKDAGLGTLIALECLRAILSDQRQRRGEPHGIPGAPPR